MFQLLFLLMIYLVLLFVSSKTSPKGIWFTPQFGYVFCFIPGTFYALFFVKKWNFSMQVETLLVLAFGAFLFVIVSITIQWLYMRVHRNTLRVIDDINKKNMPIIIAKYKLIIVLMIEILCVIWTISTLRSMYGNNLGSAIFQYRMYSQGGNDFKFILANTRFLVTNLCFLWIYLLIHSFVFRYKTHYILLMANLTVGIISELLSGTRGNVMFMIVSGIAIYSLLYGYSKKWKSSFDPKILGRIVIVMILILITFNFVGNLLGRNKTVTVSDNIAEYMSAEIMNLDTFIRSGKFGVSLYDSKTLRVLLQDIEQLTPFKITTAIPKGFKMVFNYTNGYSLGNVYTNYMYYINDMGYFGVWFFVTIMAISSQLIMWKAIKSIQKINRKHVIDYWLIVYGFAFSGLFFSFFSERYFELIFTTSFLKRMLFIYVVGWFLTRFEFGLNQITHKRRYLLIHNKEDVIL